MVAVRADPAGTRDAEAPGAATGGWGTEQGEGAAPRARPANRGPHQPAIPRAPDALPAGVRASSPPGGPGTARGDRARVGSTVGPAAPGAGRDFMADGAGGPSPSGCNTQSP